MPVQIRTATEADLDVITQFCQMTQALHAKWYPREFRHAVDGERLKALLKPLLDTIAIAESEGVPVGCVWFELQSRPETIFTLPIKLFYVHLIAVAPEARHRRVGTALMEYVCQRAQAQSIDEIALSHSVPNIGAQQFSASCGFAPHGLQLRKMLGDRI